MVKILMIDLVDIRKQIKDGIFTTYLSNGIIYLKNNKTDEHVAIGSYTVVEEKIYADGKLCMLKTNNLPNKEPDEVNTWVEHLE